VEGGCSDPDILFSSMFHPNFVAMSYLVAHGPERFAHDVFVVAETVHFRRTTLK
jgi:hypothetical protein